MEFLWNNALSRLGPKLPERFRQCPPREEKS